MRKLFKTMAFSLFGLVLSMNLMAADYAPVNTILWGETFDHFVVESTQKKASEAGTGTGTTIYDNASITYGQSDGQNTKGINEELAKGTAPELLIAKSSTWTISGIKSGAAKEMSLTFLSNKTTASFALTCSSDAYTLNGSDDTKSWTLTLVEGKTAPETFDLTLKNTNTYNNARVDNVVLKVTKAAVVSVSTSYIDENGEEQEIVAAEVESASEQVTWGTAGETTWYVVNGTDVQLAQGAVCAGDVRLILVDGAKLTATGWLDWDAAKGIPAIQVSGEGNSLTIYAQSTGDQMGQLNANGDSGFGGAAGIGGEEEGSGTNITINGGTIIAIGNNGYAGIGGGSHGSGSNITINGGNVTATGGGNAAGIGGGQYGKGENITINGGIVKANGGTTNNGLGAGIGGGQSGNGENITINGGEVIAIGANQAAGIGGGRAGSGTYITINGGAVTATGGDDAIGIGSGYDGASSSNIYISDAYILNAGADKDNTEVIAHSSATDLASTLTQQYVKLEGLATPYTRTMTANSWGTVCLPYAATSFEGATFYKLNYYNGSDKLYIEEVSTLEAGMPYVFQATAETVTINHEATAPMAYGEVGDENGLFGSFARETLAYDAEYAYAAISGGSVVIVGEGNTVTVPACRAYLDMNEVATSEQPHTSPLRCISVPSQTPTGLGQSAITNHKSAMKVVKNGQFVIIRDNKMYNAQGVEIQ